MEFICCTILLNGCPIARFILGYDGNSGSSLPNGLVGLFQRVIVQSGSALCDWATDTKPLVHARTIAHMSDCERPNDTAILSCLRQKSVFNILIAHSDFLVSTIEKLLKCSSEKN